MINIEATNIEVAISTIGNHSGYGIEMRLIMFVIIIIAARIIIEPRPLGSMKNAKYNPTNIPTTCAIASKSKLPIGCLAK